MGVGGGGRIKRSELGTDDNDLLSLSENEANNGFENYQSRDNFCERVRIA